MRAPAGVTCGAVKGRSHGPQPHLEERMAARILHVELGRDVPDRLVCIHLQADLEGLEAHGAAELRKVHAEQRCIG